jgi:hypothetical protein
MLPQSFPVMVSFDKFDFSTHYARKVHFLLVSTLSAIKQKKRHRKPGLYLLANALGKGVSTIRRWIEQRPELRRILRVRRVGKQWRINYPTNQIGFEDWVETVRHAVATFSRTPKQRNDWVKGLQRDLGFGGGELEQKQRNRELEILRHAMLLKRASIQIKDEQDGEDHLPETDLPELETEVRNCCFVANWIAARFQCPVREAVKHWAEFCRDTPKEKRTDEDIAAEVTGVERLWPTTKQWDRAQTQLERDWQIRILAEAAWELMRAEQRVTGINLAPLVFRNQRTEDTWLSHQQHLELKAKGNEVFCDEETLCRRAKRGISVREFRQRYTKRDLTMAIKHANAAYGAEPSVSIGPAF